MTYQVMCGHCGEPVRRLIPSTLDGDGLACAECGSVIARDYTSSDEDPWWVCPDCSWEGRDPEWGTDEDGNIVAYCPECEEEVEID